MASGERQAQAWDLGAQGWADNQEVHSLPLAEWLLFRLMSGCVTSGESFKLLDAGCGPGAAVRLAWEKGAIASGTDVSEQMLKIARSRVPHAEFVCADSECLPFPDGSFDAVMAVNSLQFTESPAKALKEFLRVTKREGQVGIIVFDSIEKNDLARVGVEMRKHFAQAPIFEGPFSLSPAGKLEKAMAEAGFVVLQEESLGYTRLCASVEEFWTSQQGSGPVRFAIEELGEERTKSAVYASVAPLLDSDGSFSMRYQFRAIIGRSKL